MYTWLTLKSINDLRQLIRLLPEEYKPAKVADTLIKGISQSVRGVLLEGGYTDKDYRSTYYHYYSKKGQFYSPDCVRLHFFDDTVTFERDKLRLQGIDSRLEDHYFGYMVLRPTGIATIGRTILSPDIRSGACRSIITSEHKAHVLGHRLKVIGFPSMDQHIDIAVCAHVACWAILRHYSERYSGYREFLMHDITMMAQEFNPGGLLPSKGLTVSHAERVFQEANTFPLHISRGKKRDLQFERQLSAYIESGFPVFAAMHKRRHAIAIVGQEWKPQVAGGVRGKSVAAKGRSKRGVLYAWDMVANVAAVDDNYLPYLSVPVLKTPGSPYSVKDIDAFIVALPEKIFYPADAVDQIAPRLLSFSGWLAGLPSATDCVIRYFVTTAPALRHFVRVRESEFPDELLQAIMTIPFTQFVWIVELATAAQWANGNVAARAVIDATASLREPFPIWLFHGGQEAIVVDRKTPNMPMSNRTSFLHFNKPNLAGFSRLEQNLRLTQPK